MFGSVSPLCVCVCVCVCGRLRMLESLVVEKSMSPQESPGVPRSTRRWHEHAESGDTFIVTRGCLTPFCPLEEAP